MSISEIAEVHRVSRTTVHAYRRGGTFPAPVQEGGTTRLRFRADEVASWFQANPKQQGRRADLTSKTREGATVIEGQMGSQPLNGNDARAVLGIVWQWIENANDGLGSDVGDLMQALGDVGYGPVTDSSDEESST